MISEAATTGKPIFMVNLNPKKNIKRFRKFYNQFKEMNIIRDLEDKNELWTYNKLDEVNRIATVIKKKIVDPRKENLNYDGTRAIDGGDGVYRQGIKDGGKAKKLRCYVTKENSEEFPHLKKLIDELSSKNVHRHLGKVIGKDLSNSYVRLEVICDREGFWLKPHCDIKEKLISSLIFVNPYNESEDLGTDLYDKKLNKVKTVPYKNNYGYFFTCGPNTWHGMEKKKIKKERRCIQINYVTFPTDWKVE
jgi:hypothetical protein